MEAEKKAYKKILSLLKKCQEICIFDVKDLEDKAKCHLFGLELKEVYGLNIDPRCIKSTEYNRLHEYIRVHRIGENNHISWSDDGRQPKDEMLLSICFPTGAYIFGDDYDFQEPLFNQFFSELKSYNPKYSDSRNKTLYFTLENAKDVFNDFKDILNKYQDLNKKEFNTRRIEKLKIEIEKLQK